MAKKTWCIIAILFGQLLGQLNGQSLAQCLNTYSADTFKVYEHPVTSFSLPKVKKKNIINYNDYVKPPDFTFSLSADNIYGILRRARIVAIYQNGKGRLYIDSY